MNLTPYVTAMAAGNKGAFQVIVQHLGPRVDGVFLADSVTSVDHQEFSQRVFLILYVRLMSHTLPRITNVQGYALRVARNIRAKEIKRSIVENATKVASNDESIVPEPTEHWGELVILLGSMSKLERTIVQLRYEGYTHDEIATALDISSPTSRDVLCRLRKRLRKHFRGRYHK